MATRGLFDVVALLLCSADDDDFLVLEILHHGALGVVEEAVQIAASLDKLLSRKLAQKRSCDRYVVGLREKCSCRVI